MLLSLFLKDNHCSIKLFPLISICRCYLSNGIYYRNGRCCNLPFASRIFYAFLNNNPNESKNLKCIPTSYRRRHRCPKWNRFFSSCLERTTLYQYFSWNRRTKGSMKIDTIFWTFKSVQKPQKDIEFPNSLLKIDFCLAFRYFSENGSSLLATPHCSFFEKTEFIFWKFIQAKRQSHVSS